MKADVADIVASVEFINQSLPLPSTTIFTPNADGIFRISAYLTTGNTDTSTEVAVAITWTDEFRLEGTTGSDFTASGWPGSPSGAGAGANWKVFVIRVKVGTPIQISTSSDSGAGGLASPYDLFVIVEQF